MDSLEKCRIMAEVQRTVVDYLQDELKINSDALRAYDTLIGESDPDVKRMREIEAIKLRDRINELNRHIAVIKRMYPHA